ncbi:hypothetical protein AAMO2058_000760900 [Amorphochlora amoebiformis]
MKGKDCSVRVAVRVRPLSSKEKAEQAKNCLGSPQAGQLIIGRTHAFTYDYVFEQRIDQQGVYDACVMDLVNKFMQGFNATILAYGQTGSGKTYTMGTSSSNNVAYNSLGIVPRVADHLFKTISEKSESENRRFSLKVQFLEIYNDAINDLLNTKTKSTDLHIRETKQGGIHVPGASEAASASPEEMLDHLDRGTAARVTGSTAMNATSSRSHAIFSLVLEQTKTVEMEDKANVREDTMVSKFHFVDLAGSERLKRTGAEGARMREGININKGLLALGNVISALGDEKRKGAHVPFRDSKITRLLQDSLGGNSQTLMIACVSPSDTNFDETLNTLKYANRARNIKNKPIINRDPMAAKLEEMGKRIKELEAALVASGNGELLTQSTVSSKAYEDVTNQLVESELEIKKLNDRLVSTRTQLTTMRDKCVEAEGQRDKYKAKATRLKDQLKSRRSEAKGGDGEGESANKEELELSSDSDDPAQEQVNLVVQLRRKILDLEAKLVSDSSIARRPRASIIGAGALRRLSLRPSIVVRPKPLGEATGKTPKEDRGNENEGEKDEEDDDDAAVEVHTPFGTGTLVESRDDGMLAVLLPYGVAFMRDVVTTPLGTGAVIERKSDGNLVVALPKGDQDIPSSVCASHYLPDDDEDDDNVQIMVIGTGDEAKDEQIRLETLGFLTSEVKMLDKDIQKKELLMKKLIDTHNKAHAIEQDYTNKINNLEHEVKRIREERDQALSKVSKKDPESDARKQQLIHKYELKLKKLNDDLKQYKKKLQDNQKLLRSKAKASERLKKLKAEVTVHKKQRVALQKKMKESTEEHRNWIAETRKELKKAMKERNKAELKVSRLKTQVAKQAMLIKRRDNEREVLKQQLKKYKENLKKSRGGNHSKTRKKTSSRKQSSKTGKKDNTDKVCMDLEYELGEAVAKSELTARLNEKLRKLRETKTQRVENKRRLGDIPKGSVDHQEALEEADTLKARQKLIENQVVQLRTDLALWSDTKHPGNLTPMLFNRLPKLGVDSAKTVLLQLLDKIVRQEMRSKHQDRVLDQLEYQLAEAKALQAATVSSRRASMKTDKLFKQPAQPTRLQRRRSLIKRAPTPTTFGAGHRRLPWEVGRSDGPVPTRPSTPNQRPRKNRRNAPPRSQTPLGSRRKSRSPHTRDKPSSRARVPDPTEFLSSLRGGAMPPRPSGSRGHYRGDIPGSSRGRDSRKTDSSQSSLVSGTSSQTKQSVFDRLTERSQTPKSVFDRLTDRSAYTGIHRGKKSNKDRKKMPRSESQEKDIHPEKSRSQSMLIEGSKPPTTSGFPPESTKDVFSRLTDKSSYTGMYRQREKDRKQTSPKKGLEAQHRAADHLFKSRSKSDDGSLLSDKSAQGPSFTALSETFNEIAQEFNSTVYNKPKSSSPPKGNLKKRSKGRPKEKKSRPKPTPKQGKSKKGIRTDQLEKELDSMMSMEDGSLSVFHRLHASSKIRQAEK